MNTPGPETSVPTSVCAFPQKEQRYSRLATLAASASDTIFLGRVGREWPDDTWFRCRCDGSAIIVVGDEATPIPRRGEDQRRRAPAAARSRSEERRVGKG